jgi:hypothetical protein
LADEPNEFDEQLQFGFEDLKPISRAEATYWSGALCPRCRFEPGRHVLTFADCRLECGDQSHQLVLGHSYDSGAEL